MISQMSTLSTSTAIGGTDTGQHRRQWISIQLSRQGSVWK